MKQICQRCQRQFKKLYVLQEYDIAGLKRWSDRLCLDCIKRKLEGVAAGKIPAYSRYGPD